MSSKNNYLEHEISFSQIAHTHLIRCSQIGASHIRESKPNQDFSGYESLQNGKVRVLCVSDGHGSKRSFRSDLGSEFAVDISKNIAFDWFSDHTPTIKNLKEIDGCERFCRKIIHLWTEKVHKHFKENPLSEDEKFLLGEENNFSIIYGATLVLAVITPSYTFYVQLGDGNIISINEKNELTHPITADSTVIANDTHSLCETNAADHIKYEIVEHSSLPKMILLTTDGLPNSFATDKHFNEAILEICLAIDNHGIYKISEEIPKWLKDYTELGSGDDITLAIFYNRPKFVSKSIPEKFHIKTNFKIQNTENY